MSETLFRPKFYDAIGKIDLIEPFDTARSYHHHVITFQMNLFHYIPGDKLTELSREERESRRTRNFAFLHKSFCFVLQAADIAFFNPKLIEDDEESDRFSQQAQKAERHSERKTTRTLFSFAVSFFFFAAAKEISIYLKEKHRRDDLRCSVNIFSVSNSKVLRLFMSCVYTLRFASNHLSFEPFQSSDLFNLHGKSRWENTKTEYSDRWNEFPWKFRFNKHEDSTEFNETIRLSVGACRTLNNSKLSSI